MHWSKAILSFAAIAIWTVSLSQDRYRTGVMPKVNVSKDLGSGWKLNAQVESRHVLAEGAEGSALELGHDHALVDMMLALKKAIARVSLVGGYVARADDGITRHLFLQQFTFNYTDPGDRFKIAQRARLDEIIREEEPMTFRLRYRLSAEIPLDGFVDSYHFYVALRNEYVYAVQKETDDLEIRFVPSMGYRFSSGSKLELGLDSRFDSLLTSGLGVTHWGTLAWYINF